MDELTMEYNRGYDDGFNDGEQQGRSDGYNSGTADCAHEINDLETIVDKLEEELDAVEGERDTLLDEVERLQGILNDHGITISTQN